MARKRQTQKARSKIRYAVVGQGYISQVAVLPAFKRNQEFATGRTHFR